VRLLAAALIVFPLTACAAAAPAPDLEAEAAMLMETSRAWSAAAGSGDIDAILSYWADDAVMMPPGQPPLRGKAAIRDYVESGSTIPGFSIEWEPLEAHVATSGDMAYLIERNRISFQDSTGATVTETNKVVTVWRKQHDGSWKNVLDMWNADPSHN
jgi:uncharacterized protein (TIGR02246 family)